MDNAKKLIMNHVLLIIAIVGLTLILGCWEDETTVTVPKVTLPVTLQKCLKDGVKIKLEGKYLGEIMGQIDIGREATIKTGNIKVEEEGEDELEQKKEGKKIDTWDAPTVSVKPDGNQKKPGSYSTYEDCYEITYKKGPFPGPGGAQCRIEAKVRICEDSCTITGGSFKMWCGVDDKGKGGKLKVDAKISEKE